MRLLSPIQILGVAIVFAAAAFGQSIDIAQKADQYLSVRADMATSAAPFSSLKATGSSSICRYLDDCPDIWKPITIDELIHHTSGIPDYGDPLELCSDTYNAFMTQTGAMAQNVADAPRKPPRFSARNEVQLLEHGVQCSQLCGSASRREVVRGVCDRNSSRSSGNDGKPIFTLDASGKATQVNMRYSGVYHIATR